MSGSMRISKRAAKLIRIGIMSKCYWYKSGSETDSEGYTYYYTVLDFGKMYEFEYAYQTYKHYPLVQKARERTKPWVGGSGDLEGAII